MDLFDPVGKRYCSQCLKGTYHAFKSFIFTYKSYRCGLYKT